MPLATPTPGTTAGVRDVTYDEDRSQIRTGTGPEVMAALRHAAIGALRTAGITNVAAANRHHARDSTRPPGTTRQHLTTLSGLALVAAFRDPAA
ncbi:hypothetical protein [Micromonospora avicenniae]|uniref:hypothetical protein n=1 Tax=Micromonospora avicenniae TaxID=1198245 RepID=UPI00332CAF9C